MSLRGQALEEFDLPAAPQRIDEFPPPCVVAEARYPAPRPRRAKGGSLIARLKRPDGGAAAAACYVWPPGEVIEAGTASVPQLLEVGRLLGRLHQLGEAHPASVPETVDTAALLGR